MRILLTVTLSIAISTSLRAQAAMPELPASGPAAAVRTLAPGDRVRLESAAGRYAGTIVRVTADTLVVGAAGRLDAIPRADVTRLQRSVGRSPRGRAILIGAGAGLLGGGVLGAVAGRRVGRVDDCGDVEESCTVGGHDGTIQGALLAEGAVIGALVGAMMGPAFRRERWENAADAFPLAVGRASGGGVAARVTLRF